MFTLERYWTEEKERVLIAFFSKHSCLWNHKSESYKNRQLRWRTLDHLRILLSAHPPPVPFSVEDIKNKFKNLRTTFHRQYKMVKASKGLGSEDAFVPQWKYYQQMMFLQGSSDQGVWVDDLPPSPPDVPEAAPQPVSSCFPPSVSASAAPSCVLSGMMIKCVWTEERERVVIAFFSEHSCLWNKKSENHNNRQLRLRLLEALRNQLSDHAVSFSVEDIKCKFKNLRTVFNREYKAVQTSRASDKPYVSKWKHYQQLLFLLDSCEEGGSAEELQALTPQEDGDLEDLSSTACSSTQAESMRTSRRPARHSSAQSDDPPSGGPASQICSAVSPNVKAHDQPAPSASSPSSTKSPDGCADAVQADVGLSADSRCRWSDAKVQQLILFYSNHSCLWSHKSESYRNRLLRQSLLETLSSLLSDCEPVPFTVEDIKTKFRNLRTTFQREHKAISSNRTCGSEDFYLPKWKHYGQLMFLCESCDEDKQPEGDRFQEPQKPGLLLRSQAPPEPLQRFTTTQSAATLKAPPSPTPPDSQHSSPCSSPSPSTSSSRTDSRISTRKRSSHQAPHTNSDMLDFMRTFCQSQTASPHAGFLKYVEECLNETPPDKVKKLKKMIIETIHSVSEDAS
ncbi:uncharacterized protein LOC114867296 [Betta splendens]|uniref:Uncharacterized protein LOC114867296 n=1 Tax=Betta splendens TaxID=158456 RepID=A0A6P7P671_BETSP|nr:uncharacterized protein LOC114867296 [Betta splendens]